VLTDNTEQRTAEPQPDTLPPFDVSYAPPLESPPVVAAEVIDDNALPSNVNSVR